MASKKVPTVQFLELPPSEGGTDEFTADEIQLLHAVNQKVAAAETLDETMRFVFEATRAICPCDRLGLALIEEEGGQPVAVSHEVLADYEPLVLTKGYREKLEGSSLARVLESGQPRIINDLEAYLREHPGSRSTELVLREGVRSSLTSPLIVEKRPVGFLFRSCRRPGVYDERQARINRVLAERMSQTVEKVRRIEQLTAANRAYREVVGFVSHELKSPLASLVMDGETLLGGYLGDLAPAQSEKVRSMVRRAHYLLGLIRDYLNMDRLERGGFESHPRAGVNIVSEVLTPAFELLAPQIQDKGIRLTRDFPRLPVHMTCDPHLLEIAMLNLVGNAVKYAPKGAEVRVTLRVEGDRLRCTVWNEGPGFPDSARDTLFKKFSRVQTPQLLRQRGTGVGLYTTWRFVRAHGGTIHADSQEGYWAEFTFEIPLQSAVPAEESDESDVAADASDATTGAVAK